MDPEATTDCGHEQLPGALWCVTCAASVRPHAAAEIARAEKPAEEWSRFRGGVSSFGLAGRLLVTAVVIALTIWLPVPFNIVFIVIAGPLVLRDTWKRTRIR